LYLAGSRPSQRLLTTDSLSVLKFFSCIVMQAIPYVNGTLYSLLAHPEINVKAKLMDLSDMLKLYLKVSS
jgi:hypothetical protein